MVSFKKKFEKLSVTFKISSRQDIKAIKKSKKLFDFADKTSNIYQIKKDECNKLTNDAIRSAYKKIPNKISNKQKAKKQTL